MKKSSSGFLHDLLICLLAAVMAGAVLGGLGALLGQLFYSPQKVAYAPPLYGMVVALLLAGALVVLVSAFSAVRRNFRRKKKSPRSDPAPQDPTPEDPAPRRSRYLTRLRPQTALLTVGVLLLAVGLLADLLLRAGK